MYLVLETLRELNFAVSERKERIVLAASHILARDNVGTTLTDNNLADLYILATKTLGTETLTT